MKTIAVIYLFLYSINSVAQPGADSAGTNSSITFIKDSIEIPVDTVDPRPRNIYGDLMNDDPRYNRRYSVGLVLARVTSSNVFGWAYSRYVMKEEWAEISIKTIKNNFRNRWEWDKNLFAVFFQDQRRYGKYH